MSETVTPLPEAQTSAANDGADTDAWVRTRMCFCFPDAETDCRFHSESEPGWEQCPGTEEARLGKRTGRWLWGRNPNFGKISAAADESLLEEAA